MAFRFSCEVSFPSAKVKHRSWWEGLEKLAALRPSFFSLTCKSRTSLVETPQLIGQIQARTGIPVVAHLTAWNRHPLEVRDALVALEGLKAHGILALHGDIPLENPPAPVLGACKNACHVLQLAKKHAPSLELGAVVLPDGNPHDLRQLPQTIRYKAAYGATQLITQACYDRTSLLRAVQEIRAGGCRPVLGLYIPEDAERFLRFSQFCHVGSAPAALEVLQAASDLEQGIASITGAFLKVAEWQRVQDIHVFTMNRFEHVVTWLRRLV